MKQGGKVTFSFVFLGYKGTNMSMKVWNSKTKQIECFLDFLPVFLRLVVFAFNTKWPSLPLVCVLRHEKSDLITKTDTEIITMQGKRETPLITRSAFPLLQLD